MNYPTQNITAQIAGLTVSLLQVADSGVLLDALIAKGDAHDDVRDERLPYWAELWPSAVALATHLVAHEVISPGASVTEIGCGLGLPGIVAGKLGAQVILSDYLPEALEFAAANWALNLAAAPDCRTLDWRAPDPAMAADVLLGSDITYERRFFEALPHAFRTLCKPGGTILLSDPCRKVADDFFDALPALGFMVQRFEHSVPFHKTSVRVRVIALRPA